MFSRRAPIFGPTAESTVQLIKGEDAERRYLRPLSVVHEQGALKLVTKKDDVPPLLSSPGSSSPTPNSSNLSTRSLRSSSTSTPQAPVQTLQQPYYELLYRGPIGAGTRNNRARNCLMSLWRLPPGTSTLDEALDRLQVLARLAEVLFASQQNPHTRNVQSLQLIFQQLINTMVARPGWRAVHIAAYNTLLDYFTSRHFTLGALELNSQVQPDQSTPLHIAVKQGHLELVNLLLQLKATTEGRRGGGGGVNVRLLDADDNLVFHVAACEGPSTEVLERLLTLAPELRIYGDLKNRLGWSPVELAALGGRKEHLRVMIAAGLTARALSIVGKPGEKLDPARKELLDQLDNHRLLSLGTFFSRTELVEGFTFNSIKLGGCPLHWTNNKRLTYRLLIEGGFHADTPNLEGETALLRAVRANRNRSVMTLLTGGADPRLGAAYGETPLVVAVMARNAHLVRALLVFGADVDQRRAKDGASVRHLAAAAGSSSDRTLAESQQKAEILDHLIAFGAGPCPPNFAPLGGGGMNSSSNSSHVQPSACNQGCLQDQAEAVGRRLKNLYGEHFQALIAHRVAAEKVLEERRRIQKSIKSDEQPKTPVMMICFDGGGVRGLLTVQILLELSVYLRRPLADYFDWIAGTSTGSIIGAAVANGRTIKAIRALYFRFKDVVLSSGGAPATDNDRSDSGGKSGRGRKPYSSEHLVALLQREFGAGTRLSEVTRHIPGSQQKQVLIVTATRVDQMPARLTLFTSFEDQAEEIIGEDESEEHEEEEVPRSERFLEFPPRVQSKMAKNIEVWRALRASSAAPFYFNGYPPFIDGGLLANNPTIDCLAEFLRRKASRKSSLPQGDLRLILSLGTGCQAPRPSSDLSKVFNELNFFRKTKVHLRTVVSSISQHARFKAILQGTATNANRPVVDRAEAWAASLGVLHYRLNVPLSFKMALDETDDGVIMRALLETRLWARTNTEQLKALAEVMEALMEVKMRGNGGGGSGTQEQQQTPSQTPDPC